LKRSHEIRKKGMKRPIFLCSGFLLLLIVFSIPVHSRGSEKDGKALNVCIIHAGNVAGHLVPCPT